MLSGVLRAGAASGITPYDCWGNLSFLPGPVNIGSFSANGTAVSFPADPTGGHAGGGPNVLHMDGSSYVSVWGGRYNGSVLPTAGDSVGGSFWIYLLSAPAQGASVDVRMTGYDSGNAETVFCHTSAVDLASLPLQTWVEIPLTPASATWVAGLTPGFNILSSGGVNCYVNAVTFGRQTDEPAGASPLVSAGNIPVFQAYSGSTFNGDFEVGNASVGNQYWGSGAAATLQFITNPAATAPGAAQSGYNMAAVGAAGFGWNTASLSSSAADSLPRAGDKVGGYYWLYVPASADVAKGFPTISFSSYDPVAGDIIVSDSGSFPAASLVKGAWNQIPIYPVSSARNTVQPNASRVAIILTAPASASYASPFYIDNISVGKIPAGVFFSPSTSAIDSAGNTITALDASATTLSAEAVVQNSLADSALSGFAVLNIRQQGVLKSTVTKPVTIPAMGASGLSFASADLRAPLDGLSPAELSADLTVYGSDRSTVLAARTTLLRQVQTIAPSSPKIQYVGRWSAASPGMVSDYVRPYFKFSFTGSYAAIHLTAATNLDVTVDGATTRYSGASGYTEIARDLAPAGVHTVTVAAATYPDIIRYDALHLDASGTLVDPVTDANEIEFIGDSITAWNDGYSWLVPRALGVESSRICWPGIALQTGYGYVTTTPANIGMQDAYFNIAMATYGSGTAGLWSFSQSPYKPRVLVVNLGTNDAAQITGTPGLVANFQTAYVNFLKKLRSYHPDAQIFVMRPVSIPYANVNAAIANAAQAVIDGGDNKAHFIDTTGWTVEILSDGIHPSPAGHAQITNYLIPILQPYLASSLPSFVSASGAACARGDAFAFQVAAAGHPAPAYAAAGLPSWLSLDSATGLLSGAPSSSGPASFTITATNSAGSATQAFTLAVSEANGPGSPQSQTTTLAAGTGTARTNTFLSLPLLGTLSASGQLSGVVTGVTATTFTNANAGWTAGQLSNPASPCLVQFTSGAALGRAFLLSTATANTATTATLDPSQSASLAALGVTAGDAYELVPCPTIASVFGTPATTGILGGVSANEADQVQIFSGNTWKKYYFNTTSGSWRQASLETAAGNIPIPPSTAVLFSRLAASPLTLSLQGRSSRTRRVADIAGTGITPLSSTALTGQTLAAAGMETLPGWVSGASPASADTVMLWSANTWKKYYFDGSHWRAVSLNTLADSVAIPAGGGMLISRAGSAPGSTPLIQNFR